MCSGTTRPSALRYPRVLIVTPLFPRVQWDLVCDDDYLSELSLTLYMVGATCGTLLLTPLSDRWGRKALLLPCLWLQAVVGVALTLVPTPLPFIVLQFFVGLTNMVC